VVITLMGENNASVTPSTEELMSWADTYGLSHPVVADPNWGVTTRFVTGSSIGLPAMHLLGPGAEVLIVNDWVSESDIVAALPE
jgi:hypothetical protein